jgi:hypothetical protein
VEYWPDRPGTVLRFEGGREKNGRQTATERLTFRSGTPTEIDGESVEVQHVQTVVDFADGRSTAGSMVVFQHLDENSTFTRAVEFPEGGLRRVPMPMIDLKVPLDLGSSWISRHVESFTELGIEGQVAMTYTSTIVKVGETREVAIRLFEGCLQVFEAGVSVSNHEAICADGSVAQTKVLVDRTRWWCRGLGSVEEATVAASVRVEERDEPCAEIRSTYNLVEIDID